MKTEIKEMLDTNVKEKIANLEPKATTSAILQACGLGETNSPNSILIRSGKIFENLFNHILVNCPGVTNTNIRNKTTKKGQKQIDISFNYKGKDYYYEVKCNLYLDSEKKQASKNKIEKIQKEFEKLLSQNVQAGYFVPCNRRATHRMKIDHPGILIHGVEDLIEIIGQDVFPFTADEYFDYLEKEVGPVLEKKLKEEVK